MEYNYLKTSFGKIHAAIVIPSMVICFLAYCYEYAQGREPFIYGLLISIIGFMLFLKAKLSVIRTGKLFSFGCDLMDQKNTFLYFFGWVMIIGGYFLSWK